MASHTDFTHGYSFDPSYGHDLDTLLGVRSAAPPGDFDEFWGGLYAAARAVTVEPEVGPLEWEGEGVRTYPVSYASVGGIRLGGWLTLPSAGPVVRGLVALHGYGGRQAPELSGALAGTAAIWPCALTVPPSVTTDDRNNPWGTRSGTFRVFFPYTRNGDPNEISNEMGAAWGTSRAIDTLQLLAASGDQYGQGTSSLVAPDKLAVTGHSIYGKYAFLSAVFDERIAVCIPSAAGANGPSPYRYIYMGHQYSWGVADGTEMLGDTIRHNPGRTTELHRRFLTPGRFYERLPGAWGYGDRMPFDHHELVATLAPRAIVLHGTVNDYGDGAESDPLGLEAAKFVYGTLGFDADDLVKFNVRPPVLNGQPHAEDTPQRNRTAEYLEHYFYGRPMSPETAAFLDDDPFDDQGARAANAYNRYYGGYETIAPWKDYTFPRRRRPSVPGGKN
jgi:hypothetical protein